MSDKTGSLDEGDYFHFRKVSCVVGRCNPKKVITRTHGHRGQLIALEDGVCIIEKLVWYPAKV